ncbi:MAG TPA: TetR/AcrR family transcriptional regulator [Pirellulales bacterium]|nr:TetR/AcrR family transcriptional regulator [Pirellulales bacterium]
MPTATRQNLIDAARKRFYRDGFRNVGIDQILSDVGISKTAFYKHFDCKEDLMLAALDDQDQWLQQTFRDMVHQRTADKGPTQLMALFDVVDFLTAADDFAGCIFVNAAIEFPLPHDPAHQAAARSKQSIEALIEQIAADAGASDPHALAQELCLIMEGVYVTKHVSRNPAAVDIARRIAQSVIAAYLPSAV